MREYSILTSSIRRYQRKNRNFREHAVWRAEFRSVSQENYWQGWQARCPLHNLVPEWNDLIYNGNWKEAYLRLKKTNNFPEFTSRVCPALCENACTCGLNQEAVASKSNEYAIIENAYEMGYAKANPPKVRTGKKVAVIGSGPSGLAAADLLNQRGHQVTVFERACITTPPKLLLRDWLLLQNHRAKIGK